MRLAKLARSVPVTALALVAITNACSLPQVQPRLAADFASGQTRVRTLAVLPVDLDVQVAGQGAMPAVDLTAVENALVRSLGTRGYRVSSVLRPDGQSRDPDGTLRLAIHPRDLAALRVDVHQATLPSGPGPGMIEARVSADLTRQVALATGAEASLYARGWAFVNLDEPSRGAQVAAVLVGILLVLLIVGIIFASKSKGGGKGAGAAASGIGRGLGRAAMVAGHVAIRTLPYVAIAAHHQRHHVRCYTCPPPPPPPPAPTDIYDDEPPLQPAPPVPAPPAPDGAAPVPGPTSARAVAPPRVAPRPPPPAPAPQIMLRSGPASNESTVGFALTLVHNKTGRVLWHAGRNFGLRVEGQPDIDAVIDHFVKALPLAR